MEKKLTQNEVFRTIRNWLILAAALTAAWVLCSSLSTVGTSDTFVPMIFILAVLIVSLTTDGYFYGIVTSLASVIGVHFPEYEAQFLHIRLPCDICHDARRFACYINAYDPCA